MEMQMTVGLWCVLLVMFVPLLTIACAKMLGGGYSNRAPRSSYERFEGWRRRAVWAEQNAYEAFPPFAVAMLMDHFFGVEQHFLNQLGVIFLVSRICYTLAYLADQHILRTVFWSIGFGAVMGLFYAGVTV